MQPQKVDKKLPRQKSIYLYILKNPKTKIIMFSSHNYHDRHQMNEKFLGISIWNCEINCCFVKAPLSLKIVTKFCDLINISK